MKLHKKEQASETITVNTGYDLHKIILQYMNFIEIDGEYVNYHTKHSKAMSCESLKSLENLLDQTLIMRVH